MKCGASTAGRVGLQSPGVEIPVGEPVRVVWPGGESMVPMAGIPMPSVVIGPGNSEKKTKMKN